MIEDFRFANAGRLLELFQQNFPEEERVYGTRPEAWSEVVKRIHHPMVRLIVAMARWVRHPIYRFFTIMEGDRLAATTIVSFSPRIGYISSVMVDPPFRRRGFARRLMERSHQEIAAFHRPNAVLDVLSDNAPAQALYRSMGYRPLRTSAFFTRELSPASAPTPSSSPYSGPGRVRPFRRSDRSTLARTADASIPTEIARILPSPGRRLTSSMTLEQILGAESESWVLEEQGRPTAWARATSSKVMDAAGLATPIVDPSADPNGVASLLETAVHWCRAHNATRVVLRVPNDDRGGLQAVQRQGFASALSFDTLYLPLS